MATTDQSYSSPLPHWISLVVPVPGRLNNQSIDATVKMFAASLRFRLGEHYRRQIAERTSTRRAGRNGRAC